jgi:two-component system response regulator VicR
MKTILVVDDEYALVESITELLQEEGYRVVSAGNGRDGLAMLQKEKPDLVLVDFMMPIADGKELVGGMRSLAD